MNVIKYKAKSYINAIAIYMGKRKLEKYNMDIIHVNGIDNYVAAAIASALNIPCFWHIRQFLQEDLGKTLVDEEHVLRYLRNVDGVIGISDAVKMKYEALLNRKVRRIYNGIPINGYNVNSVPKFQNKEIRVLLAGRITQNKGQIEAVRALAILKNKGVKDICLTIVGNPDSEYLDKLRKVIKDDGVGDIVTILDYCDDLSELYKRADIGLVCSKNEAFGRVTIEYMCAGMLVIGADTGGTVELIGDEEYGLLYEQGNAKSLADKIEYAIGAKEKMKRIGQKAKKHVIDYFSIERVCDDVLDYYSEFVNIEKGK